MINTRILIAVIGLACSAASAQHQEQGKHRQGPAPEGMRNNEGPMDGDHAAPPRQGGRQTHGQAGRGEGRQGKRALKHFLKNHPGARQRFMQHMHGQQGPGGMQGGPGLGRGFQGPGVPGGQGGPGGRRGPQEMGGGFQGGPQGGPGLQGGRPQRGGPQGGQPWWGQGGGPQGGQPQGLGPRQRRGGSQGGGINQGPQNFQRGGLNQGPQNLQGGGRQDGPGMGRRQGPQGGQPGGPMRPRNGPQNQPHDSGPDDQ